MKFDCLGPRIKINRILNDMYRFHAAPLSEGPTGLKMHKNLVLMTLTYVLGRNHLLQGEPGWGKTTGAKLIASRFSGLPYDTYDALEMRCHPQKYEEKLIARPDYAKLFELEESVIWQGCVGLPVLLVDEGNRLPYDTQDALLQAFDTGRWTYLNQTLYEGKKPAFVTMNERPGGSHQNGFLPAMKDRMDIVTEQGWFDALLGGDHYDEMAQETAEALCDETFTTRVMEALAKDYKDFKAVLRGDLPIQGFLTPQEVMQVREAMLGNEMTEDARLFLDTVDAEINFSWKYGCKRSSDPISDDDHDKQYAGVKVHNSFSPRSKRAASQYARALAWFLHEEPTIDHVRFVLPHVIAHKAAFTDDFKHASENSQDPRRKGSSENMNLAIALVEGVQNNYEQSVLEVKNFIYMMVDWMDGKPINPERETDPTSQRLAADIQKIESGEITIDEAPSLKEEEYDLPILVSLVRKAKAEMGPQAFYEDDAYISFLETASIKGWGTEQIGQLNEAEYDSPMIRRLIRQVNEEFVHGSE